MCMLIQCYRIMYTISSWVNYIHKNTERDVTTIRDRLMDYTTYHTGTFTNTLIVSVTNINNYANHKKGMPLTNSSAYVK